MLQIEIEPVWRFHKEGSPQTVAVMLGVLNDIHMAHLLLDDLHSVGPKAGAVERAIGYCLGWHSARAKAIRWRCIWVIRGKSCSIVVSILLIKLIFQRHLLR